MTPMIIKIIEPSMYNDANLYNTKFNLGERRKTLVSVRMINNALNHNAR